ncbi:ribonuclease H-like domain-containing protein [Mycena amicta]|nr:ribonuclease H-like domain-containing protein [Mycena amicta]
MSTRLVVGSAALTATPCPPSILTQFLRAGRNPRTTVSLIASVNEPYIPRVSVLNLVDTQSGNSYFGLDTTTDRRIAVGTRLKTVDDLHGVWTVTHIWSYDWWWAHMELHDEKRRRRATVRASYHRVKGRVSYPHILITMILQETMRALTPALCVLFLDKVAPRALRRKPIFPLDNVLLSSKHSGTKRAAPEEDDDEPSTANAAPATHNEATTSHPTKKIKTQTNLDGVVDRPMMKAQQDAANRKLLRYFVHSNTGFLQANSIFLADFTNEICPSFQIASHNVMSTLRLDSEHSRVHLELVDALQAMKRSGTFIYDGWEDELCRSLYGSAVGRVGEPTIIMGLQDVTGKRGSADKLLKGAETAMTEMGIEDASCLLAVVTDNPNVMKAFRNNFVRRYPWIIALACWAHQLNTLVREICRYAAAKSALQKANRTVSFFNGSHYWGGQLKIAALAENITCGLKKDCESCWYALIVLALSVWLHQTPLSVLVARPDARKPADNLSPVNADVIHIVQDINDEFWPWIDRIRQLSTLDMKEDNTREFKDFVLHAKHVVDKRFRQMATPIHRLALFLHPLCRKLAVVDARGFTLCDVKRTALEIAEKWGWTEGDGALLAADLGEYHACRAPFAGGRKDARGWWKTIAATDKAHPLKPFAIAILGLVPHSAEIERLFSSCNGIQSPKRNCLAVETFLKLAKVRSSLVEEANRRAPPKKSKKTASADVEPATTAATGAAPATRLTSENSTLLDRDELLEKWKVPMEGEASHDAVSGVDAVFNDLDRRLEEEEENEESVVAEEEEDEELPATVTAAAAAKKKKASELSLMDGDVYDFALVKKALESVVPREEVQKVDVVKGRARGGWNIDALL